MGSPISHFVFVDFENVPAVDLGLVEGQPVHVTLLIGKKQTRLDLQMVHQIKRQHFQVDLVEVGASGHNALDMTLAYYLGRAVQRNLGAQFHVVSKDKDFEPMIAHLRGEGLAVERYDSFSTLNFLPKPKKTSPAKITAHLKTAASMKLAEPIFPAVKDERLEKLILRFKNIPASRPKKKSSLLAYLGTVFGGKLSDTDQGVKLDELIRRGVLKLDVKDKVVYM